MSEPGRGRWLREAGAGYLTTPELDTVARFLDQLEAQCGDQIARVILFGSRARGDYEPESDIDLLIVTHNGKAEVTQAVSDVSKEEPYLSTLVLSGEEYRKHQWLRDPLYINVRRDGIELWNPSHWLREEQEVPLDVVEGELRTMDEASMETIRIYLDLARDALEVAEDLSAQGRPRHANSKAYYATHYALVAALYALNVVRSKHSGVQAALSQFLVKPGYIEEEYKDIYADLRRVRQESDYEPRFTPEGGQTAQLVADADRFVTRMEEFLREQGAFDGDEESNKDD